MPRPPKQGRHVRAHGGREHLRRRWSCGRGRDRPGLPDMRREIDQRPGSVVPHEADIRVRHRGLVEHTDCTAATRSGCSRVEGDNVH
jgi:hypothetical protein